MKERYRILKRTEPREKPKYIVQKFCEKLSLWYWLLILVPVIGWIFLTDAIQDGQFKESFWEDWEEFSIFKEAKKYLEDGCELIQEEEVVWEGKK